MGKTYKKHDWEYDDNEFSDYRKPNKTNKKDTIREQRKLKQNKLNHIGEDDDDNRSDSGQR